MSGQDKERQWTAHIVKPVPMHAFTSSPEAQANADPQVPIYPETLPGSGYRWALVSACWQVTRSQTMPMYPHDTTMIISYGRWVWTWERRRES